MPNQPHSDKKMMSFRLPRDLIARFNAEAKRRGITGTDFVIYAFNLALNEAKS